jgi:hypothetical protein
VASASYVHAVRYADTSACSGLHRRIRQEFSHYGLGGDHGADRLLILAIRLFLVGARHLEHLRYLAHDPLMARSTGWSGFPRTAPS